jgi:hypothetical protein
VTPRGRPVSGVVLAVQAFVAMDEPQRSRVDAIRGWRLAILDVGGLDRLGKLGQPHPDSNLSDEANSGSPDTMST